MTDRSGFPTQAPEPITLVCFDYEGRWGMPIDVRYDLDAGTAAILACLRQHRAHAVFFVVGRLAVEQPDLIRALAEEGHEIGLHGWRHEHIDEMTPAQWEEFSAGVAEATDAVEQITGQRPVGFRAPYLLAPLFFHRDTYDLLRGLGYRWVSNREIRYPVELLRPDRLRTQLPWRLARRFSRHAASSPPTSLMAALNPLLFVSQSRGSSARIAARWFREGCPPYARLDLTEVPVRSPLDCDLLGLPSPQTRSPASLLNYARYALGRSLRMSGPIRMLTFHDWIISGGNRLGLLDSLLADMAERGVSATTLASTRPPTEQSLRELGLSGGRR